VDVPHVNNRSFETKLPYAYDCRIPTAVDRFNICLIATQFKKKLLLAPGCGSPHQSNNWNIFKFAYPPRFQFKSQPRTACLQFQKKVPPTAAAAAVPPARPTAPHRRPPWVRPLAPCHVAGWLARGPRSAVLGSASAVLLYTALFRILSWLGASAVHSFSDVPDLGHIFYLFCVFMLLFSKADD